MPALIGLIAVEELIEAEDIVRADSRVQKLCEEVGVERDNIMCDGWALGNDPVSCECIDDCYF